MKTNKDIGHSLKNKLEGLKDSPDAIVWTRIEKKLKKKKRKILFWYFSAGIGSLVILSLAFHAYKYSINDSSKPIYHKKPKLKTESKNEDFKSLEIKNNINKHRKKSDESNDIYEFTKNIKTQNDSLIKTQVLKSNRTLSEQSKTSKKITSDNYDSFQDKLKTPTNNSNQILDNFNRSINDKTKVSISNNIERDSISNTQIETLKNDETEKLNSSKTIDSTLIDEIKEVISEEKVNTIKDSVNEIQKKWSINPQYIISKYGAFNAKTNNDITINYGILIGLNLKDKAYLRFGIKKLSLMNTINGVENKVEYLEIPIEVKYRFLNKKLNPFATVGISYFKLQSNTNNGNNIEYTNFTISPNFGIGIEYKLFESFYLNIQSNFNYQIKPILNDVGYNPYIFSISTGIEYRF